MWRAVAIIGLTSLLAVSVAGNVFLFQQRAGSTAETQRQRVRALSAEQALSRLQASGGNAGVPPGATPGVPVPTLSGAPTGSLETVVQQLEGQVESLHGLRPTNDVTLRFLGPGTLRQYLQRRFDRDYLPSERESDQKLLVQLGLLRPDQDIVQAELDLLNEQMLGEYSSDDKTLYIVGNATRFDAEAQSTFVQEFTHALQDQTFDLNRIAPKHPANNDQAAAVRALIDGDAVLLERLWAQQNLTPEQQAALGQSGDTTKLDQAPPVVRADTLFPSVDGFSFALQLYHQRGGYAGIDTAFQQLPTSTAQILHPEQYVAHQQPVTVMVPDLATALGQGWRQIDSNVLGEFQLRTLLEQYATPAGAAPGDLATGWRGDRWELLEKDGHQALVLRTVWGTDADASRFFAALGQGLQSRFPDASPDEQSAARQALTTPTTATELRRTGTEVLVVISFDRSSADLLIAALG